MAYINLNQIGELALAARTLKHLTDCQCYNTDGQQAELTDELFVAMIKTHRQADNLFSKLRKMHQLCTDFVAGKFQPYIDEFEKWKENDTDVFDPFEELERCFNTFSVDDLPVTIEQYSELLTYSRSFADQQKVKREGLKRFFGNLPRHYLATDGEGQTVLIPEAKMPEAVLDQRATEEEIADIEVEYCLDGYNEFYQIAAGVFGSYAGASEDVTPCAEVILGLFSPYSTTN